MMEQKEAKLKVAIHGLPGDGKTTFCSGMNVLLVSLDPGGLDRSGKGFGQIIGKDQLFTPMGQPREMDEVFAEVDWSMVDHVAVDTMMDLANLYMDFAARSGSRDTRSQAGVRNKWLTKFGKFLDGKDVNQVLLFHRKFVDGETKKSEVVATDSVWGAVNIRMDGIAVLSKSGGYRLVDFTQADGNGKIPYGFRNYTVKDVGIYGTNLDELFAGIEKSRADKTGGENALKNRLNGLRDKLLADPLQLYSVFAEAGSETNTTVRNELLNNLAMAVRLFGRVITAKVADLDVEGCRIFLDGCAKLKRAKFGEWEGGKQKLLMEFLVGLIGMNPNFERAKSDGVSGQ